MGQIITVYESDNVDVYKITPNRELEYVSEGKGVMVAKNATEAQTIASKNNTIGNLILRSDNKTIHVVIAKNVLVEIFSLNNNNEIVFDGGDF